MWYRSNAEVAGKCDANLSIFSPGGEKLSTVDMVADLTSGTMARTICGMQSFPVSRQGIYVFVVSQKKTKEGWAEVARLPLQIVIAGGQAPIGIGSTTTSA
jgi:hypothetical protein